MEKRYSLSYWLKEFGYEWIGDKHPTHPVKQPYGISTFEKERAKVEISGLEEDGYVIKRVETPK